MGHDGLVFVWHGSLFLFFHFSAYTEKDRGGWVWVWVGLLVHHISLFFWNACMVVYGFAWFDRVDSFGRKK